MPHTVGMSVSDENRVYTAETILRKPFHSGCLEALANVYDNCAIEHRHKHSYDGARFIAGAYSLLPSGPGTLSATDVLRYAEVSLRGVACNWRLTRIFFFPSGFNVDKQVWHGVASGGAVRQST